MPPVSTVRINGRALRALRISRGLEVRQLAARVGRHPQSVRRLETGHGKLAGQVFAQQLANALKVNVSEFTVADEDEPEGAAA